MRNAKLVALKRLAKSLGATVEIRRDRDGLEHEVLVDAPVGTIFSSSGVHQLVCAGADGTSLDELYADAIDRLVDGVEPCDDRDCDVCHETEENL